MKRLLLFSAFVFFSFSSFAQPNVTISNSVSTMDETGSITITATLDAATGSDVVVNFDLAGIARHGIDFKSDFYGMDLGETVAGGNGYGDHESMVPSPHGVDFDAAGNLYILEPDFGRITRWVPGATEGVTAATMPYGISYFFVDDDGNIYATGEWNHVVIRWMDGGTEWDTVAGGNGEGDAANQLRYPTDVCVDADGNVFVADRQNHRVQKWAPGATEGETVAGGNGAGNSSSQLNHPSYLAIDENGNLYIWDEHNSRMQRWEQGALTGESILYKYEPSLNFFLDKQGCVYIDDHQNSRVQKWSPNNPVWETIAGGNGDGNASNQLYEPRDIYVDTLGNFYIADRHNHRIQYFQVHPQITILATETTGTLTLSAVNDDSNEDEETLILDPESAENATLVTTDPFNLSIIDNDSEPTISFAFSEDKIIENSVKDVKLRAIPSEISGKDINISLSLSGDATETSEYIVSTTTLQIPADAEYGEISISTNGLDDPDIELLESIIFSIDGITNASSATSTVILYLDSDDDPDVSLSSSSTTFNESESLVLTATSNGASSRDVVIDLDLGGMSLLDLDYETSFSGYGESSVVAGGNGQGYELDQTSNPIGVFVDQEGNIYVLNAHAWRIEKWAPGAEECEIVANWENHYERFFVDDAGTIYVIDQNTHRILKWTDGATSWETAAGGNGQGSNDNQFNQPEDVFVDASGNIYVVDIYNHRVQKWAAGATEGVTVAGGNGQGSEDNQLNHPMNLAVHDNGDIFIFDRDNNRIQKWSPGSTSGVTVTSVYNHFTNMYVDQHGAIYADDNENSAIRKWSPDRPSWILLAGGNGQGNNLNQFNHPYDVFFDYKGNMFVSDHNNHRIIKYQFAPQIIIPSGQVEASLTFSGINDASDEEDETIEIDTFKISNANISTVLPYNLTIIDNDAEPTITFGFSSDMIGENSSEDIILKATPSVVSGKDIDVNFSVEGDATPTTEYTLSSSVIQIPANSSSGELIISTNSLDDTEVEMLESIRFILGTINNATTLADTLTVYLDSDDDPTITLSESATNFNELGSTQLTAALDFPASKDVIVELSLSGQATSIADYSTDFYGKGKAETIAGGNGEGGDLNQTSYPNSVDMDDAGNLYVLNGYNWRIDMWAPGATSAVTIANWQNHYDAFFVAGNGDIYVTNSNQHSIDKWPAGGSAWETVAGGNGAGTEANQLNGPTDVYLDSDGNIYICDQRNHRVQLWASGATSGTTVAGGNGLGSWLNQLYNPNNLEVDSDGNIYIMDRDNGRIMYWEQGATSGVKISEFHFNSSNWIYLASDASIYSTDFESGQRVMRLPPGSTEWETVVGGNGVGTGSDQLNNPNYVMLDTLGNIIVSDHNNHRIQKYQMHPQITVLAGETTGSLTIRGVDDVSDEPEESLIIGIESVQNGILSGSDSFPLTLNDNDPEPELSFAFSAEKIAENAAEDLLITVSPEIVSGKDITLSLSLAGDAQETTEYVISTTSLTIPANSTKGEISISTSSLDDGEVEMLEDIAIVLDNIENATSTKDTLFVYLESDDDPNVTLLGSVASIEEDNNTSIIASVDAPSSKDVIVNLDLSGTAFFGSDYSIDFKSKGQGETIAGGNGEGGELNQTSYPNHIAFDDAGNLYVLNHFHWRIDKWAPGEKEGITIANWENHYEQFFVTGNGDIYVATRDMHRIDKWSAGGSAWETVAGGNGAGINANQFNSPSDIFVDSDGNMYVCDMNNNRIQLWAPGASEGTTVAGGNGGGGYLNQFSNPSYVEVNADGDMYIMDRNNGRILLWRSGADIGEKLTDFHFNSFNSIFLTEDGSIYSTDYDNNQRIIRWSPYDPTWKTVVGENGVGTGSNQLNSPTGIVVDSIGNIYVSDHNNHRIQKFQMYPQIMIAAGEMSDSIFIVSNDDASDEHDEDIIVTVSEITNGILDGTGENVLTIIDNDEEPELSIALSADRISENSLDDLLVTLTPDIISGKDIEVTFTLGGEAEPTTEYLVGSTTLSIPANNKAGSIAISTDGLDDSEVEILESIILQVETVTYASLEEESILVYLESDDNPGVLIGSETASIEEDGSQEITASLTAPTSRDVIVDLTFKGTADLINDYSTNFPGKGRSLSVAGGNGAGSSYNQLWYPRAIQFDPDGNLFTLGDDGWFKKWAPESDTGRWVANAQEHYDKFTIDKEGNIYAGAVNGHRIDKWEAASSSWSIVAGGNGQGNDADQFNEPCDVIVMENGDLIICDRQNNRVQLWEQGATEGITIAGGNSSGNNANQLNYPQDIDIDSEGNIYILDQNNGRIVRWVPGAPEGEILADFHTIQGSYFDVDVTGIYVSDWNNHQIVKWSHGDPVWRTVAGGNGQGNNDDQLNNQHDLLVDSTGNIYVVDRENHRIQRYQYAPELKVPAGSTTSSITINAVEDNSDEHDETIVLDITGAQNGIIAAYEPDTITIVDNDEEPVILFSFSDETIVEDSDVDVQLFARSSVISGKDIQIQFDMAGVAETTTEYSLSSTSITIPAKHATSSLSISTDGLDDALVEVLESVEFVVESVENAVVGEDTIVFYVESDDDPGVIVEMGEDTIPEHKQTQMTAILDAPTSNDVIINLEFNGTAGYEFDFTTDFIGKGEASTIVDEAPLFHYHFPDEIDFDAEGNLYILNHHHWWIEKWNPDYDSVVYFGEWQNFYNSMFVDAEGNIYVSDENSQQIQKWSLGGNSWLTVAGGNGYGFDANQFAYVDGIYVDEIGNIYAADRDNNRIQKWTPGAMSGMTVAGGNDWGDQANQLRSPRSVTIGIDGRIYILEDGWQISIWEEGAAERDTIFNLQDWASEFHVDKYGNIFVTNSHRSSIDKWSSTTLSWQRVAGGNGRGVRADQLNNPTDVYVDSVGNIFVSDAENQRIQKFHHSPQIRVPAGETQGSVAIVGIEDEFDMEGNEFFVPAFSSVENGILNSFPDTTVTILDNSKTLTLKSDSPFPGLSQGAVAWGDYDRDGDLDVAVMGMSPEVGALTALYVNDEGEFTNTNQYFTNLYYGDLSWVDLNKDGWIDLVVSGLSDVPETKVYMNVEGMYFQPANNYGLPHLGASKMDWGDLDNDGDIDLAITGIDTMDQYQFYIYYRDDLRDTFLLETGMYLDHWPGLTDGDLKIVDIDLDGDNDLIITGIDNNLEPYGRVRFNSFIDTSFMQQLFGEEFVYLKNSTIEAARMRNDSTSGLTLFTSGEDREGNIHLYQGKFYEEWENHINYRWDDQTRFPKLKYGDISIADFSNDGRNDIVFTGEDQAGNPTTKLYLQYPGGDFHPSPIELKGLRNSTADWVDYDMDGDLDLFLSGVDNEGAQTLLYESEIKNKSNAPPERIENLRVMDLSNGKIRFEWDVPEDDYSSNLGYVLRLGTSPGGTELSNTESDLVSGARLISKSAPIYNSYYETSLDPGHYYWAVQAVDPGISAGEFSEESDFVLTYDWKRLNQGGIVDMRIPGMRNPVIKLADVDNDDDKDMIYGSASDGDVRIYNYQGKKLEQIQNNPVYNISRLDDAQVGDINGDGTPDILVNDFSFDNQYNLRLFLSQGEDYYESHIDQGLYNSEGRIVDLNNDGKAEIVVIGLSNNLPTAKLNFLVYEFKTGGESKNSKSLVEDFNHPEFDKYDLSSQITSLSNSSFDLGDFDNDQDIDLLISGQSATHGYKSFTYENVTELGGDFTFEDTGTNLVAVTDGTSNLIDIDSDGDLDAVITGTSTAGDVFEIYRNIPGTESTYWGRMINHGLTPMRNGKIDLGDFNGDGYTDFLYSGLVEGEGETTLLSIYDPDDEQFYSSPFDVSDIINAEVEFGDLEGDGDLDFALSGENKSNLGEFLFRAYVNVRNESAEVLAIEEADTKGGSKNWLSSYGSKADAPTRMVNRSPSIPEVVGVAVLDTKADGVAGIPVEFSWMSASDDHTPETGLTYALKVGTTPGGEEIMSANANTNGIRQTTGKGNAEHNLKWNLLLAEGTYYWSVQAVDAAHQGSRFSMPSGFTLTNSLKLNDQSISIPSEIGIGSLVANIALLGYGADTLRYTITSGNEDDYYSMDTLTGAVSLKNQADCSRSYSLGISVTDGVSTDNGTLSIYIEDLIPPVVTCPQDVTVFENETNGFSVRGSTFDPSNMEDDCGNLIVVNDFNNSSSLEGALLPVGITAISWTISDAAGNDVFCTSYLTVNSSTNLDSVVVNDQSVRISDDVEAGKEIADFGIRGLLNDTLQYAINSGNDGGLFEIDDSSGVISVIGQPDCEADYVMEILISNDSTSKTAKLLVEVIDVTDPEIICKDDHEFEMINVDNYLIEGVFLDPEATDNCEVLLIRNDMNSDNTLDGALLPKGVHDIVWQTADASGNKSSCTQRITITAILGIDSMNIVDKEISISNELSQGVIADFGIDDYTGGDLLYEITEGDSEGIFTINPADGSIEMTSSPICNTQYNLTITIADGSRSNTGELIVNIIDEENPVITCLNDTTIEANSNQGYLVTGSDFDLLSATDNCGEITIWNGISESSTLENLLIPNGVNIINWQVTDEAGNMETCNMMITVSALNVDVFTANGIAVYPNPTKGKLNLEFSSNSTRKIEVLDVMGRVVLSKILFNNLEEIDISDFEDGIYILSVEENEGTISGRIIKQ